MSLGGPASQMSDAFARKFRETPYYGSACKTNIEGTAQTNNRDLVRGEADTTEGTCWCRRCRHQWQWCNAGPSLTHQQVPESTGCAGRWCSWRRFATTVASCAGHGQGWWQRWRLCRWSVEPIHSCHFPVYHSYPCLHKLSSPLKADENTKVKSQGLWSLNRLDTLKLKGFQTTGRS